MNLKQKKVVLRLANHSRGSDFPPILKPLEYQVVLARSGGVNSSCSLSMVLYGIPSVNLCTAISPNLYVLNSKRMQWPLESCLHFLIQNLFSFNKSLTNILEYLRNVRMSPGFLEYKMCPECHCTHIQSTSTLVSHDCIIRSASRHWI